MGRAWTFVGLLVVSVAAATAGAADRFVARSGTDSANDCLTATNPCATVSHAMSQASSGDTINVAGGKYRDNVRIDFSTTLTFLGGWGATFTTRSPALTPTTVKAKTIVMGTLVQRDRPWAVYAGPGETIDVTIDGFTLTKGIATTSIPTPSGDPRYPNGIQNGGGLAAVAFEGGSLTLTVRNTTISGSRAYFGGGGMTAHVIDGGTLAMTLDAVTLLRNHAADGGGIASGTLDGPNASLPATLDVALVNCVVANNQTTESLAPAGFGGGGMFMQTIASANATASLAVVNSTFVKNRSLASRVAGFNIDGGGGGLSIVSGNGSLTTTLRNTIIWGNKVLPSVVPGGMLTGFGDDLFMNGVGPLIVTADHLDVGDRDTLAGTFTDLGGNVNVDPELGRGFHLRADSPLIDVGTCAGAPLTDFEGDPRPSGAGCDIGADEFQF